jgi:hypothetical protein
MISRKLSIFSANGKEFSTFSGFILLHRSGTIRFALLNWRSGLVEVARMPRHFSYS